jgi:hypothetical protein
LGKTTTSKSWKRSALFFCIKYPYLQGTSLLLSNGQPKAIWRDYDLQTAFLKRMLSCDQSPEGQKIEKSIARAERDHACALRAACAVGLVAVLSAVLLQAEFFQSAPAIGLRIVCVIGLAAIICLPAFLTIMAFYRLRLNTLREDSRRLILRSMEARNHKQADSLLSVDAPSARAFPAPVASPTNDI